MSNIADSKDVTTMSIGQPASDFNLMGVDGKMHQLRDYKDAKILIIIFICNHCPTAQAYEERIIQLVKDYQPKGVTIIAISPNDPMAVRLDELGYADLSDGFEDMKIRAKERGFNFPYLYDGETQQVSLAYGPVSTPHVFIFDQQRILRYCGRIDDSEKIDRVTTHDTRNALNALLQDKPVPVEKTKTFGCSIKWAEKRESARKALVQWDQEPVSLNIISDDSLKKLLVNPTQNLLLINFWATWCGPCVVEFPELVTINRMYRNREFQMISISTDTPSNQDKVLSFLTKQHASFTNFIYHSENPYQLLDLVDKEWQGAIPYTIMVAPGGQIIHRHSGIIGEPLKMKQAIIGYLGRYYK